ncbi:Undecaprenyl phosphate-alpha-4-amino-4-deoxy-L-arabinose arabinosyl transferase (Undecaprenyl phosphate-alpha-L-Ara4N transferase) (4-amino-4-deoxy-L-arabinose lipid A transferase) (plasmid) [Cupriavidus taiwanensis]|uniref:Undecaprenyl phosphate-alpha-4-amino-4-deoxy-L-arabinose arabinosyl transferase (Undecaprenyl phosphate-alpha-L-Ara4N transferase) (4-amino-4-deoxy-L-arabinose lipid A transferase) n=1 Tax=Cupriavidus taiwanensis TaxID=164546 RepID=A0A375IIF7_9BURK|nr:glycosyltransferase family 39 protein [Cupriavidus taiwanensis]SPK74543.1 Undecaprenyl phosphate-alpha-4-amino-4-deoxy-L-arabinose arabinosyl transferase (Undecaprenyl phosphate-alpha-L-Ara4N transferase) (4-amino-4-deoxy-L-arabinose lipid A transferase) [Cupriavidus taiwanensis]
MRSSSTSRFAAAPSIGAAASTVMLVGLLILLVWFGTLDMRHLLRSDEGRYAEIAREMVATGDWVTIRYHALKYFEKPPFHMWVSALAYTLFGVGDWQARLCVALSGMLGIGVSMLAAARWYGCRVAMLTGLVLVSTPMWNVAGHFNSLDMTLSAAMACVLACMLLAQHPAATPAARRNWMLACWAAMGVAVLVKGLVGLALPGLVLVVYTLATRDWKLWGRLHLPAGIAVLLAVTVPWFWLMSERNPEFLRFFFIHEHWQRYTSSVHHREGALWFFVPLLLAGFLPWLGLVPQMWQAVRERAGVARGNAPRPFQPALLAGLWAVAIFVFFSLSGSKLPGYIVPVFPALALLAGVALDTTTERTWRRQVNAMVALGVIGLIAMPFVGMMEKPGTPNAVYREFAAWLAIAFAVMLGGALLARRLLRTRGVFPSVVAYALAMFLCATIGLRAHEAMGRPSSGADLVPAINAVLAPDMPLYSVRLLDHTLPFYLRRTTILVEHPDELEFGIRQEPQKWIPSLDQFLARWQDGQRAVAIMAPQTYAALAARGVPMHKIAGDRRRVAVANFALPGQPARTPAP